MSRSLNKVQLIGNLGADPEVRVTQAGKSVANFTVATSESWTDQQGQKQERTEWHRVVIFGKLADIAKQYLRKGHKVYIEGQLATDKWTDQQGQERYTTKIQVAGFGGTMLMLGGNPASSGYQPPQPAYGGQQQSFGGGQPAYQPPPQPAYQPPPSPQPAHQPPPANPAPGPAPGVSSPSAPPDDFNQSPNFDDDIPF